MPLPIRNLAIAQQQEKERYRLVWGGGWDHPKTSFKAGEYVPLKKKTKHTLDVPARLHILRVVEVKDSEVVVLGGGDAARIEEIKNIAHNPLPILDHNLYLEWVYREATTHCRVCGRRSGPSYTVLCESCNHGYHLWCLEPHLEKVPEDGWKCPRY